MTVRDSISKHFEPYVQVHSGSHGSLANIASKGSATSVCDLSGNADNAAPLPPRKVPAKDVVRNIIESQLGLSGCPELRVLLDGLFNDHYKTAGHSDLDKTTLPSSALKEFQKAYANGGLRADNLFPFITQHFVQNPVSVGSDNAPLREATRTLGAAAVVLGLNAIADEGATENAKDLLAAIQKNHSYSPIKRWRLSVPVAKATLGEFLWAERELSKTSEGQDMLRQMHHIPQLFPDFGFWQELFNKEVEASAVLRGHDGKVGLHSDVDVILRTMRGEPPRG